MAVGTQDLNFRVLAQVVGGNSIDGLKDSFENLNSKAEGMIKVLEGIGIAFGIKETIDYGKSILDVGDNLYKLSQKTGASVEQLAKLKEQAELADVPFDSLIGGLRKLSVNLVDAAQGNQLVSGTLKKMGVDFVDSNGHVKDAATVLDTIRDKFSKMQDGPEKAAIAVKLFGKSGSELIPLLNRSSEEVSNFAQALDTDFGARAEAFNDSIKKIGFNLKAGTLDGLKELLPTLQEIADALLDLSKSKSDSVGFFDILGEAARVLAIGVFEVYASFKDVGDIIVTDFKIAKEAIKGNFGEIDNLISQYKTRRDKLAQDEVDLVTKLSKNSLIFGQGTGDQIKARQKQDTAPETKKPGSQADVSELGEIGKLVRETEAKLAKMKAESDQYGESNAQKQIAVQLAELEAKGLSKSSAAYAKLAGDITKVITANNAAKEKNTADEYQAAQEQQIELQSMALKQVDMTTLEYNKLIEAKKIDNQVSSATKKFTEEGAQAYRDAAEDVKAQRLALLDLEQQQKETWSTGAKQALKDYLEAARDTAAQVKGVFAHAFSNMEDSLVSFIKTGKLDFSKFADDLITDIIRIQVRAALAQTIIGAGNLFGQIFAPSATAGATTTAGGFGDAGGAAASPGIAYSAHGNVMTEYGPMALKKYAAGGIARSPQLSVFGEGSQPEAYVPLADGRSIPVTVNNKGNGDASTSVSIVINMDKNTESQQGDSQKGMALGKMISTMVKNQLVQEKRPGGLLA